MYCIFIHLLPANNGYPYYVDFAMALGLQTFGNHLRDRNSILTLSFAQFCIDDDVDIHIVTLYNDDIYIYVCF